jgi:hypothetical protein
LLLTRQAEEHRATGLQHQVAGMEAVSRQSQAEQRGWAEQCGRTTAVPTTCTQNREGAAGVLNWEMAMGVLNRKVAAAGMRDRVDARDRAPAAGSLAEAESCGQTEMAAAMCTQAQKEAAGTQDQEEAAGMQDWAEAQDRAQAMGGLARVAMAGDTRRVVR